MTMKERGTFFKNLPIIGGVFKNYDRKVRDAGIQQGTEYLLKSLGSRVEVKLDEETREVLATSPVLLIANHSSGAEIFPLLAALPARNDVHAVAGLDYISLGPNLAPFMLPVYSFKPAAEKDMRFLAKIRLKLKVGPMFSLSPEDAKGLNRRSLEKSREVINGGGMVIVCPAGPKKDKAGWYTGIGHMVSAMDKSGAYLVFAYVEGTSNTDLLRFIPGAGKFLPAFRVYFSSPMGVEDLPEKGERPIKITHALQEKYIDWVGKIR